MKYTKTQFNYLFNDKYRKVQISIRRFFYQKLGIYCERTEPYVLFEVLGSDMEAWLSKVTWVTSSNMAETKYRDALFTYVILFIFIFKNDFNDSRNLPIGRNQSGKNKFYRGRECVKEMIFLIEK